MLDLLLRLVFPLGFFAFGVRLILDLMGVELHFTRLERAMLSLLFAAMCFCFTLASNPTWDNAAWYILIKLFFAGVIVIMGRRTLSVMIKLHTPTR